jgi:NDP-sugar pyrophosphorylase family protein
VTGFAARGPSARGSWHFVGVQAVEASVFAALPVGVPRNSIGGVYDDLVQARPGSIRAFRSDVRFWDVGTPADYWRTSRAFSARSNSADGVTAGRGVVIDPSARIRDSILWDAVEVGADALLEECIVTDGARVPAGARYRRAIVMRSDGVPAGVTVSPLAG